MTQIRISYVRATFAAGLLAGVRLSLLEVTDLLKGEQDLARSAHRRESPAEPEPVDTSSFVAAALYAEWIADALHRQIAFYFELDQRVAGTFDGPQLPPTEGPPHAPPEWPRPPLPEPLRHTPNPLTGITDSTDGSSPRDRIAAQMLGILEDIDDAMPAINWARNVRLQTQIIEAAVKLREWVAASATALAGGR
jgi:hypothetical protein